MPEEHTYKVGVGYDRYGYITVTAPDADTAVKKAQEQLEKMTVAELDEITEYMPDSEALDTEFVTRID